MRRRYTSRRRASWLMNMDKAAIAELAALYACAGWGVATDDDVSGNGENDNQGRNFTSFAIIFTFNKISSVAPAIENIGNMDVLAHYTVNDECITLKSKVPQPVTKVWSCNTNQGEILKIVNANENPVSEFFSEKL